MSNQSLSSIEVLPLIDVEFVTFRHDMQQAFQAGVFVNDTMISKDDVILPDEDINGAYYSKDTLTYKAVFNDEIVGGAMISLDESGAKGSLVLLYIRRDSQGKGYGVQLWKMIEKMYPDVRVWETLVLFSERRNLHFYINLCGFSAVEFFNPNHRKSSNSNDLDDLLRLEKRL